MGHAKYMKRLTVTKRCLVGSPRGFRPKRHRLEEAPALTARRGAVDNGGRSWRAGHVDARAGGAERPRGVLDAVHGEPAFQGASAPDQPRRRHALHDDRRAQAAGRHGGPVVLQRRARGAAGGRGDPRPGGRARLRAQLPVGPPQVLRSWPRSWPTCSRAISTTPSSPTPARNRSTRRSRSRWPTSGQSARARAPG